MLKDAVEKELTCNREEYLTFLTGDSITNYDISVLKYIYKKTNNNDFCDVLILALCNATSLSCVVCEKSTDGSLSEKHTIIPSSGNQDEKTYVLKRYDHYMAIVDSNKKGKLVYSP